eukprot:1391747-Pleurochrysis_carterae.AAC.1
MLATSRGHHSDTSHTSPGASAVNTYPPTPSTPMASDVLRHTPVSLPLGNTRCGASGMPAFSSSSSVAAPS